MDGHQHPLEDTYRSSVTPGDIPGGSIQIRCPECHEPVMVPAESSLSNVRCAGCGSQFSLVDDEHPDRPAEKMVGHFELVELLGRGGFGTVWEAVDTKLQRSVAIKIARQSQVPQMSNFLREARAAAQLKHPNIVGVHEVGREGDTVYIVADLIRGKSMSEWLKLKRLDFQESAQLGIKIAMALQHAHEHGIIHRDLKPHNIIMDERDEPHLTDFGLARRDAGEMTMTMTIDGQIIGTPAYMPPEQARGQSHLADPRSDVYSLGVMLFQFMTGEVPFRGHLRMVLKQVVHDEPPSPRRFNAGVPRDLETICLKCMEKDIQKRYASALAVEEDLRRFLRGEPILARPIKPLARAWRWCKRNPAVSSLVAIVATLLLVVSVGATVASLVLSDALQKKTNAQSRADRESSDRQQLQKTEDAAGFAMLKEQIRAERLGEADRQLASAFARMTSATVLADRAPAWDRLNRIVRFYHGNDETWNRWGEEDYMGVIAASREALLSMNALDEPQWWNALPVVDLEADEQQRLQQEVYRLLLLHSAVQSVVASVIMENESLPFPTRSAQATTFFRSALKPLALAQAWEVYQSDSISISSHIMKSINAELLGRLDAEPDAETATGPERVVKHAETDNYFLGLMFFVVHRRTSNQNLLCPSIAGGEKPATELPAGGSEPQGLFSQLLKRELARNQIPIIDDPLSTSAHLLRIAAGSERRYWPNFGLGRTLFLLEKYSEAELAFGTCASLRPDYARSYEQRALMRALQASGLSSPTHRENLFTLARRDSARALTLAAEAGDPSTWWPRGDLLAILGEPEQALAAYAHALEWEDDVVQKINRRNNVDCVIRLTQNVLAQQDVSPSLHADANAVMALANLSVNDSAESQASAAESIDRALKLNPQHPHALTARGLITLRNVGSDNAAVLDDAGRDLCRQAIADFSAALALVPENHLAAKGRAELLERLGNWPAALEAWTWLISAASESESGFSALAVTPSQQVAAQQGRARVLRRMGHEIETDRDLNDTRATLPTARAIDVPSAADGH